MQKKTTTQRCSPDVPRNISQYIELLLNLSFSLRMVEQKLLKFEKKCYAKAEMVENHWSTTTRSRLPIIPARHPNLFHLLTTFVLNVCCFKKEIQSRHLIYDTL